MAFGSRFTCAELNLSRPVQSLRALDSDTPLFAECLAGTGDCAGSRLAERLVFGRDPRISGAPVGHLQGARSMTFVISSPSFSNGGKIPTEFTCDGTDVSPELIWIAQPPGTQSFTLIADDPDAPVGTWTHWVFFNLPAHTTGLPEGITKVDEVPSGGRQGPARRT